MHRPRLVTTGLDPVVHAELLPHAATPHGLPDHDRPVQTTIPDFISFISATGSDAMHRGNDLFNLSPEGRGRANEVSEGEGVRKLGIFLARPSPLTPPSPLWGEGGVSVKIANHIARKFTCLKKYSERSYSIFVSFHDTFDCDTYTELSNER